MMSESKHTKTVQARCEKCGGVFERFLDEMETHNLRVVCPHCAAKSLEPAARPES